MQGVKYCKITRNRRPAAQEVPDLNGLATVHDVHVDREMRVHQAHLVPVAHRVNYRCLMSVKVCEGFFRMGLGAKGVGKLLRAHH